MRHEEPTAFDTHGPAWREERGPRGRRSGDGSRRRPAESARRGPRGHGRGRAQRGDIRTAIVLLLAEQPMHGYQLMQAMTERTQGAWHPSPGAIYPTIAQLEDEGLVITHQDAGRRLVTLTAEGETEAAHQRNRGTDPFAAFTSTGPDLREPLHQLQAAARQLATSGSPAQLEAARQLLTQTRRSLYLILAEEADDPEQ